MLFWNLVLESNFSLIYEPNVDLSMWNAYETESGTIWFKHGKPLDLIDKNP